MIKNALFSHLVFCTHTTVRAPLWARSQILKVLSREDDMSVSVPFWGKTRSLTTPSWPWRSNTAFPLNAKKKSGWKKKKISRALFPQTERHLTHASPVNTFQIFITPFSKPVARSRLFFPFVAFIAGRVAVDDLGGLGPKASPHTGWPQLKLLSPRSVSPSWPSLWVRAASSMQIANVGGVQLELLLEQCC